ncbi:MAG TPA: hypothetical protein VFA54_17335 [Bryobacterales bacterium]|jgi:hypothetical protein|nr:hypothetical protein [Bryobacterales bacterium]
MKKLFSMLLVPIVGVALTLAVPTITKAQDQKDESSAPKKKGKKKKKDETKKDNLR